MKIINHIGIILASVFLDITLNSLFGRLLSLTTLFLCAYHSSFFSPKIVRYTAAFFVTMQACLYRVSNPFFYGLLIGMLVSAHFFNKLLREERWVRLILTLIYFTMLVIFLPILP